MIIELFQLVIRCFTTILTIVIYYQFVKKKNSFSYFVLIQTF